MSSVKTFSVIFIVLIFSAFLWSCRRSASDSDNHSYTIADVADASTKFEIADLRADNKLLTDPETEKARVFKKIKETLLEIARLSNTEEQDQRYKILAQQLAFESRFDKATEVSTNIQDKAVKDALLEDIARFQIKDTWQTYQKIAGLSRGRELPQEILEQIELSIKTTEQIDDPLQRARSFTNIALFRTRMEDRSGTVKMMNAAADACRNRKENDSQKIRKAQGLGVFANWFLHEGNKDKTLEFCKEIEKTLPCVEQPFETLRLYLETSAIYILLGLEESARLASEKAEPMVSKISEPKDKAAALLKLVESHLVIRMKGETAPLSERLLSIKNEILEAAEIVAGLPNDEAKNNVPPESSGLPSPDNHFQTSETKIQPLSREELIRSKNQLLRKIASMQAWGSPLEDVWETIEDIDPGSDRDDALIAAIEMMTVTRSGEDIQAWVEEINDPVKKNSVLKSINQTK